ncbi:MAG: glycosyltransferase family A protein [Hyphomonas sp.]|nr:glycosyltransferase family A protein [Hyphomonas sp.]
MVLADFEKTTVIVPTYNRGPLLVETLESLLAQTMLPDEIIVVDDGSPDDTAARMAAYEGRIRYVRKENSGKADTLNRTIPTVKNEFVWIVDDDDIILPHTHELLSGLLRDNPEAGFAYGRYDRFTVNEATGAMNRFDGGHWRVVEPDLFFLATLQDFFAHHPGLLVRKSAYDAVGPFSMNYSRSEDYEMLVRLARQFGCVGTQEIVFLQRQHDDPRVGGLVGQDKRFARWIFEQQEMFKEVRETGSLTDYLPKGTVTGSDLSPALTRQALITRGTVMARKKLWDFAFEDLRAACHVAGTDGRLNAREIWAIREALFSKYGCPELTADPSIAARLVALRTEGPTGRAIAKTFARALAWFIRKAVTQGKMGEAAQLSRLALSLVTAPVPEKA